MRIFLCLVKLFSGILTSIRYNVFNQKKYTLKKLLEAAAADFGGYDELRNDLLNHTPKYGNDDDYADAQTLRIFDLFYHAVNGRPTVKGGHFRINLLPTTSHVYFGRVMGASLDGRIFVCIFYTLQLFFGVLLQYFKYFV